MDINNFIYLYLLICTLIKIYDMISIMKMAKEIRVDIKDTKSFGKLLPTLFKLPFQVPTTLLVLLSKLVIFVILFIKPNYVLILKEKIESTAESTDYASEADKKLIVALMKKTFGQKYTE